MAKRRSAGPGVSFFAFQDIITAVVGIFILITLILVLELAQRVETASAESAPDLKPIVETIADMKQQIAEFETAMQERLNANDQAVVVNKFNVAEKTDQARGRVQTLESRVENSEAKQISLASLNAKAQAESKQLSTELADTVAVQRADMEQLAEREKEIREKQKVMLGNGSPVYRDVADNGRHLVLVTLLPRTIEVRDALTRSAQRFSGRSRVSQFERWANSVGFGRRHILVRIQPCLLYTSDAADE